MDTIIPSHLQPCLPGPHPLAGAEAPGVDYVLFVSSYLIIASDSVYTDLCAPNAASNAAMQCSFNTRICKQGGYRQGEETIIKHKNENEK